jgi:hypothetical protein
LPSDPREINAALVAGERCYEAHPYFLARYAERGEAFTRSDGGYLVTLASHPVAYVIQQVNWLGVLLASRGMPRWLLEVHLVYLYEELAASIPMRRGKYRKLLKAAETLRAERETWISQTDFADLAAAFAAAAGDGLAGAGELLVAAVCDEAGGIARAVPSLVEWLGDPGRFSSQWCDAVRETLACARIVAAGNQDHLAINEVAVEMA